MEALPGTGPEGLPNSSGKGRPRLGIPALACDAHMHVFDPRFEASGTLVGDATVDHYRLIQECLGTRRTVVVTPRNYGTDNGVTLDAIARLGIDQARGVAVLHPDVSAAELASLHAGGIRGVRFTLYSPHAAVTSFDMVEPLAARICELGWHLQLHWTPAQIVEHQALLRRLPATMVFDHRARLGGNDDAHPAFAIVAGLVEAGCAWVKLSGPYLDAAPPYTMLDCQARRWVQLAPERVVWGSDWPHSTEPDHKPDDAELLDLLLRWADDEDTRRRILVDNPARLYDFPVSASTREHP